MEVVSPPERPPVVIYRWWKFLTAVRDLRKLPQFGIDDEDDDDIKAYFRFVKLMENK